eukprot:scaffold496_cov380-Prasinococcus_capsulatus_cf.AAC.5
MAPVQMRRRVPPSSGDKDGGGKEAAVPPVAVSSPPNAAAISVRTSSSPQSSPRRGSGRGLFEPAAASPRRLQRRALKLLAGFRGWAGPGRGAPRRLLVLALLLFTLGILGSWGGHVARRSPHRGGGLAPTLPRQPAPPSAGGARAERVGAESGDRRGSVRARRSPAGDDDDDADAAAAARSSRVDLPLSVSLQDTERLIRLGGQARHSREGRGGQERSPPGDDDGGEAARAMAVPGTRAGLVRGAASLQRDAALDVFRSKRRAHRLQVEDALDDAGGAGGHHARLCAAGAARGRRGAALPERGAAAARGAQQHRRAQLRQRVLQPLRAQPEAVAPEARPPQRLHRGPRRRLRRRLDAAAAGGLRPEGRHERPWRGERLGRTVRERPPAERLLRYHPAGKVPMDPPGALPEPERDLPGRRHGRAPELLPPPCRGARGRSRCGARVREGSLTWIYICMLRASQETERSRRPRAAKGQEAGDGDDGGSSSRYAFVAMPWNVGA